MQVVSKHNDDKQWLWESKADGNFAVSEDSSTELKRGTEIRIFLKVSHLYKTLVLNAMSIEICNAQP